LELEKANYRKKRQEEQLEKEDYDNMLRNIKKEERVFEEKKNRERKEFEKYK
jgi:hypothetical protein